MFPLLFFLVVLPWCSGWKRLLGDGCDEEAHTNHSVSQFLCLSASFRPLFIPGKCSAVITQPTKFLAARRFIFVNFSPTPPMQDMEPLSWAGDSSHCTMIKVQGAGGLVFRPQSSFVVVNIILVSRTCDHSFLPPSNHVFRPRPFSTWLSPSLLSYYYTRRNYTEFHPYRGVFFCWLGVL